MPIEKHRALNAGVTLTALLGAIVGSSAMTAESAQAAVTCTLTQPTYSAIAPTPGQQLLTVSPSEQLAAVDKGYRPIITDFAVAKKSAAGLVGVHRLRNPLNQDLLYTYFPNEISSATTKYGYVDEGVVFWSGSFPNECSNAPVFEATTKTGVRRYSTSADSLRAQGFSVAATPKFFVKADITTPDTPAPDPTVPAALRGKFFTDFNGGQQAVTAYNNETDPQRKRDYWQIAASPTAAWYDGVNPKSDGWMTAYLDRAKTAGEIPQLVLYGIPGRDCGSLSAGGHTTAASYKAWIDRASAIVGTRDVIVIVEPDAISYCGWPDNDPKRLERQELLSYVGKTFKANNPNALLYLHAGSGGLGQNDAANAVMKGGIANMRGFAMNVSGHNTTDVNQAWAETFVQTLAAKGVPNMRYVVDTSRNGVGNPPNPNSTFQSCNNFGAALGTRGTTKTTAPHADAYLWVKGPGVSDGVCKPGQPATGTWYPELAQAIVRNSVNAGVIEMLPLP